LRDFYESYVLYSFFQFLVEVLQGEEQLTLMLKDKSPTRGVHMWGLQWCVKPWLMGQPVSRRVSFTPDRIKHAAAAGGGAIGASASSSGETNSRPIKRGARNVWIIQGGRLHSKGRLFVYLHSDKFEPMLGAILFDILLLCIKE
jgi:hypothetical protein